MFAQLISFFNRPLSPPLIKHGYSKPIEQYRGLCALLVLSAHVLVHTDTLVDNFKWPIYLEYLGSGYLSVMVFFCISGYVIGITNDKPKLDIKNYLKRRLVRLYPIYLISIILCIIFAGGISFYVLTGNLLFLQNDSPYGHINMPVFVNYATWSLNYEIVYYLLFIALFYFQPKLWKLFALLLALSIACLFTNDSFVFLSNYINGFYFWVLGLIVAWSLIKATPAKQLSIPLISMVMLHLCQNHLGVGVIILHLLGIYTKSNFNWLFDIPFCLMIMAILTNKDNAFLRFNKILSYSLPACVFIYLILHHRLLEDTRWIMCLIFWILSLLFYFEKKISAFLLDKLTLVGDISYGLYLLHIPVAYIIKKTIFINNQGTEIVVKYSLWILVTFALSFLLEKKLQPAIKKYFIPS